jgi:hypothetical protein
VDVLAGWQAAGLAVLWVPQPNVSAGNRLALPAALAAMDVRTGHIASYCPLPALTRSAPTLQAGYSVPMRQGGADYPAAAADLDLMLRTQYLAPDFRWFGGPGLPLVDVATGRQVPLDPPGLIAGIGRVHGADLVLINPDNGSVPCTMPLPPTGGCTPLPTRAAPGTYLIGPGGAPEWVPAQAVPLAFGPVHGYAVGDGTRVYRADTETAAARGTQRNGEPVIPVDLDPAGLGGFQANIDAQPTHDQGGWFTVRPGVPGAPIATAYHHTTARLQLYDWMLGDVGHVSRALADGGRTAVTAAPALEGSTRVTRFGALVDGTAQVIDLNRERGLRCPELDSYCRILAWPDGSAARA